MPAVLLTDSRVRWEPLDPVTAILVVPFGQEEERFVARFDPDSGLLAMLESMRYKDENNEKKSPLVERNAGLWKSFGIYAAIYWHINLV